MSPASLRQRCLAVLLCLACPVLAAGLPDSGWQSKGEEDGVTLYTHAVEGSDFLAVRAVAQIDTTIDTLLAELADTRGCTQWRENCRSIRLLRQVGDNERIFHMVLDLPWPVADRDLVFRATRSFAPGGDAVRIDVHSVEGELPPQAYVRATTEAVYLIRRLAPGRVELSYTVHVDLGGKVAAGLVNARLLASTRHELAHLITLAHDHAH